MIGDTSDHEKERLDAGYCPDCGHNFFRAGPRGGAAQNIECGNDKCRARFNVTAYGGVLVFAQRIERESEGGSTW